MDNCRFEVFDGREKVIDEAIIRVLLVDDEKEFLRVVSERLKVRGVSVSIALSAQEALEKISYQEFDAIVVDLSMPSMNGLETTKSIKQLKPALKVIILTGYGSIGSGVEAMKIGAFDYLEKPIQINRLLGILRATRSVCGVATEN